MKSHFIFYVSSQQKSTKFYEAVLDMTPSLNVPGMTEFKLTDNSVLGLMPSTGIRKLLGEKIPDPATAHGTPCAELYLEVTKPDQYHARALHNGATELSPLLARTWGQRVAYSLDPDAHVLAFAGKD